MKKIIVGCIKAGLVMIFLITGTTVSAQPAQIGLFSDSVMRTKTIRIENSLVITDYGSFTPDVIRYIEFIDKDITQRDLYKQLKALNVRFYFSPIFLAVVKLHNDKRFSGYVLAANEGKVTLFRRWTKKTFPLSDIEHLTIYENKSGEFWGGFGYGVIGQLVAGGTLIAITAPTGEFLFFAAIGMVTGNLVAGLAVGSIVGHAIMTSKVNASKKRYVVTGENLKEIESILTKHQTMKNESTKWMYKKMTAQ